MAKKTVKKVAAQKQVFDTFTQRIPTIQAVQYKPQLEEAILKLPGISRVRNSIIVSSIVGSQKLDLGDYLIKKGNNFSVVDKKAFENDWSK